MDETLDVTEVVVREDDGDVVVHSVMSPPELDPCFCYFLEVPSLKPFCVLVRGAYSSLLHHHEFELDEDFLGDVTFKNESEDAYLVEFFVHVAVVYVETGRIERGIPHVYRAFVELEKLSVSHVFLVRVKKEREAVVSEILLIVECVGLRFNSVGSCVEQFEVSEVPEVERQVHHILK